jgi:hypothetical protein
LSLFTTQLISSLKGISDSSSFSLIEPVPNSLPPRINNLPSPIAIKGRFSLKLSIYSNGATFFIVLLDIVLYKLSLLGPDRSIAKKQSVFSQILTNSGRENSGEK